MVYLVDKYDAPAILDECERILLEQTPPIDALRVVNRCGGLDKLKVSSVRSVHG